MNNQATLAAFEELWKALNCKGSAQLIFENLAIHYSRDRHYHTLEHVYWVLKRARELAEAEDYPEGLMLPVYWAAWFHDMFMSFDPVNGHKDEELSASMAVVVAHGAGLSTDFKAQVHRLIMATAHLKPPEGKDEAILVDADLAILGTRYDSFNDYEENVRQEWSHVAEPEFCRGREQVLERFASMPRIFTTDSAYARWEAQARSNISRSRQQLATRLDALTPHLVFEETIKGFFQADGRDYTRTMVLRTSDYDRVERWTTDDDLFAALKELRGAAPTRYRSIIAALAKLEG